ncbi:CoA transferase [Sphingomonas sp. DBB INV C78]|uniref:CaiB/BaiF CoA transferase family protein n=1 Tax=Sphingomonas sp. DBB INV C78 TaxID=3349434 RepID=UPI0036D22A22
MELADILVVSLEQAVAAPLCTQRLADAGARVIKVERPGGDFARAYDAAARGNSSYFVWLNHGKESLVLDIKDADDAALLHRLLANADVFVQNLAPGAAARAGFDSIALRQRHPRLITCDISGYGEHGPARGMKAYDLLVQCETGLAAITGAPEAAGRVGVSIADLACGTNAAMGIFQALYERERTGEGRGLAVSLFDSLAEWMAVPLVHHDYAGAAPVRAGLNHPSIAPYGLFHCLGSEPIVIAVQNDREWRSFCREILDRPEWIEHDAYRDNAARVSNRPSLERGIGAILAECDRSDLVIRLTDAGIAFGALNGVAELSRHPQLRRIRVDGSAGGIELPAPPLRWSYFRSEKPAVPDIGEHDARIRTEFA